jgi:hypothetical protein
LVLSGDLLPHQSVLDLLANSVVTVISSPLDSYTVASGIHSMTVKTLPGDPVEKIDKIQALIGPLCGHGRLLEIAREASKLGQTSYSASQRRLQRSELASSLMGHSRSGRITRVSLSPKVSRTLRTRGERRHSAVVGHAHGLVVDEHRTIGGGL